MWFLNSVYLKGNLVSGYDIFVLALSEKAQLNPNVQVVSLPSPNARCPAGRSLVISGWGYYTIWDKSESVPVILSTSPHEFLWALKQKCGEPHECAEYANQLNDSGSLMCGIGPSTARNGPYKGDSGGINFYIVLIQISILIFYHKLV